VTNPLTGDDAEARDALERKLQDPALPVTLGVSPEMAERFKEWVGNNQEFKTLMLSHQTETKGEDAAVGGGFKCCQMNCKHYVYGFETAEALRRHMGLHEEVENARREATLQRRTSNMSLDEAVERQSREPESEEERAPGANGHAVQKRQNHAGGTAQNSPFAKRAQLLPTPDPEAKKRGNGGRFSLPAFAPAAVRAAGPCLRCKVLKKRVCILLCCCAKGESFTDHGAV
jgi:hypothetical protein